MEDFYLLPVGDKLMQYDRLAVNTVVATKGGGIFGAATAGNSSTLKFLLGSTGWETFCVLLTYRSLPAASPSAASAQ